MVKQCILAFATACLFTACASRSGTSLQRSAFLYPRTFFDAEDVVKHLDQAENIQITTNDLWQLFSCKMDQKEFWKMMADPFISETLPVVRIVGLDSATSIVAYYEPLFIAASWQEERGILELEYTNCGGDWLRVYSKGGNGFCCTFAEIGRVKAAR